MLHLLLLLLVRASAGTTAKRDKEETEEEEEEERSMCEKSFVRVCFLYLFMSVIFEFIQTVGKTPQKKKEEIYELAARLYSPEAALLFRFGERGGEDGEEGEEERRAFERLLWERSEEEKKEKKKRRWPR